ncbi:MAG: 4a-hydroxytetrahydrobiopterin dehydratase [Ignavibacteriae bacterium HGW-Ignavibacteriae-2]|jgi:4a-hydroxytetrahydrobiopterin dehydratase|nr:4a-hydroxytetrahydrobiopterin dehydratase [Bacteroidota bacterium]PKL88541.1 MAG: 4a-hydroxytetrahydrobiopterin dehydratase [Ignavibacteriae bacterium HGW-Ignavibacteriae-2]
MSLLDKSELDKYSTEIKGWDFFDKKIFKEFVFKNFSDALSFTLQVGIESEKKDHHPDICLHSWNKVNITLSTHSQGGITKKDIELAKIIDEL